MRSFILVIGLLLSLLLPAVAAAGARTRLEIQVSGTNPLLLEGPVQTLLAQNGYQPVVSGANAPAPPLVCRVVGQVQAVTANQFRQLNLGPWVKGWTFGSITWNGTGSIWLGTGTISIIGPDGDVRSTTEWKGVAPLQASGNFGSGPWNSSGSFQGGTPELAVANGLANVTLPSAPANESSPPVSVGGTPLRVELLTAGGRTYGFVLRAPAGDLPRLSLTRPKQPTGHHWTVTLPSWQNANWEGGTDSSGWGWVRLEEGHFRYGDPPGPIEVTIRWDGRPVNRLLLQPK